ncbi:MAG: AbrB/MazE/SpoVT family DNA-binding domain-containing protein [Rivularia sp. (in: Bacteria)]|nr:AbrB/MazE/SpoVT family DNA-binding domain-containing protein [Rivularia sp. MS3]
MKLKVTKVGDSTGIILPKELLEKLHISQGDTLYITETPRGFELSVYDEEFVKQMDIAESVMLEDSNVLRKLAE